MPATAQTTLIAVTGGVHPLHRCLAGMFQHSASLVGHGGRLDRCWRRVRQSVLALGLVFSGLVFSGLVCTGDVWAAEPGSTVAGTPMALDANAAGQALTTAFQRGDIDTIWTRFDDNMRHTVKSRDALADFQRKVVRDMGEEVALVSEHTQSMHGIELYQRRIHMARIAQVVSIHWGFHADGQVAMFSIMAEPEPAASRFEDYHDHTALHLPFAEAFTVYWGGRSVGDNYHAAVASQRFALDLLISRDGHTHTGTGQKNEDYLCFGTPILAPAEGTVVEVVDDVADNVPGKMNRAQLTGNHIVIDHGNGEFSLLAHLRQGSVKVRVGDHVSNGQALAQCGNSGNSSEPHLHYQLQDGPEFGKANCLPAQFIDYRANGQTMARGEPVRWQTIQRQ